MLTIITSKRKKRLLEIERGAKNYIMNHDHPPGDPLVKSIALKIMRENIWPQKKQ